MPSGSSDGAPPPLTPGAGAPLVPGLPMSIIEPPGRGLVLYLYSTQNGVGCALALVGVVLGVLGLFGPLWPAVVVGLYILGALGARPRRKHDLRAGAASGDLRKALESQIRAISGKVPSEVIGRVISIQSTILNLLPRAEALPPGSEDLYILRATALEYLPDALQAYLRLPRAFATLHPVQGAKTATAVLLDQLNLLDSKMQEISDDIARNDSDRLLANGRFLREKFGRPKLQAPG